MAWPRILPIFMIFLHRRRNRFPFTDSLHNFEAHKNYKELSTVSTTFSTAGKSQEIKGFTAILPKNDTAAKPRFTPKNHPDLLNIMLLSIEKGHFPPQQHQHEKAPSY